MADSDDTTTSAAGTLSLHLYVDRSFWNYINRSAFSDGQNMTKSLFY